MTPPPVLPVIFGADVSDYSIARLFHETYGIRALVINDFPRGPINNSAILDFLLVAKGTLNDPERLLPLMQNIAHDNPGRTPIMLGNLDKPLEIAAAHRDSLPGWFLPQASVEAIARANNKEDMARILNSLGLHSPASVAIDLATPESWPAINTLREPLIIKPLTGGDYFRYRQFGIEKVAVAATHADAAALFERTKTAHINMIVQELIPGDDTTQWVVNGYVNHDGTLAAIGTGQVLLGIHQPDLLGNAGIILVRDHPDLAQNAIRIVNDIGLVGFFSMDVKIDPRDGRIFWLDLNPRMGRGHYYLKVGGINMAKIIAADALGKPATDVARLTQEGIFAIMPAFLAGKRYIRDAQLRERVHKARSNTVDPLDYPADQHPKRRLFRLGAAINHLRRTRRYYPTPTDTGF